MKTLLFITMFTLILGACNMPSGRVDAVDSSRTAAAETVSAVQTGNVNTQALPPVTVEVTTPAPTQTGFPTATATPQNPLVINAALCWVGPGSVYEVVSALKQNERVELLGRGSIPGWWIVRNPIYNDPCWVQERYLQIDPGYDTASLKVFNPPPTPTPTFTPVPTNTP